MNPSALPQTSRNRDRAISRIRSITTGTAIVASVATAGFGGLAALTYTGTSTDSTLVDANNSGAGSVAGTTTTGTPSATPTTDTTGLQAAPAPTATTKHKARVTSGGSG